MAPPNKIDQISTFIKSLPEEQRRVLAAAYRQSTVTRNIAAARSNPNAFMEYVLRIEGGQRLKQSSFHRRWQKMLSANPPLRVMILAFRESAKSTQLQGNIAWQLGRCGEPPDMRVKYVSCNESLSTRAVAFIGKIIKENPRYHAVFPHIKPSIPWSSQRLGLFGRTARDANLEAWTVMGQGVGGRTDFLCLDDVVSSQNAIERPMMQQKLVHTITQTWMPTVTTKKSAPWGNKIAILGTPWAADDFNMRIFKEWGSPGFPDGQVDFLPVYDKNNQPVWPEEMSKKAIEMRRVEVDLGEGPWAFRCQYLLDPLDPAATLFSADVINIAMAKGAELYAREGIIYGTKEYEDYMRQGTIIVGVDFAIGTSRESSYSVIWVGSLDPYGVLWPVEIIRKRMQPQETTAQIQTMNEKWNPTVVTLETNGFQRMIYEQLQEEAAGIPLRSEVTGANKARLDIGVPPMAAAMENGKIGFPLLHPPDHPLECECHLCMQHQGTRDSSILVWRDELGKFGTASFSDTVMASWLAWRSANYIMATSGDIEWRPYSDLELDNMAEIYQCNIEGCRGIYVPSLQESKTAWVCDKCGDVVTMPGRAVLDGLDPDEDVDDFELLMRVYLDD